MGAAGWSTPSEDQEHEDRAEVELVARGISTAVAPEEGLTEVQASLLQAIALALTGHEVDYHDLAPLGPEELGDLLAAKDEGYRQRIVHHMVLGELVLRPLPQTVASRVAKYAKALGIDDRFVRVARRYAQGAYGLAWMDLKRNGFAEHVRDVEGGTSPAPRHASDALERPAPDPELEARWESFADLPEETLGRGVWEMYDGRGFALPGNPAGASPYLAQHDFVHVLADYGTNLTGELEVFAFIGRADPDPKGFAWLATLIGLFETGYVADTGFFKRDVRERSIQAPGMHLRLADAIRRGKTVSVCYGVDLFEVDYHELAASSISEVRARLSFPEKSPAVADTGEAHSPGVFERAGMSMLQQRTFDERRGGTR